MPFKNILFVLLVVSCLPEITFAQTTEIDDFKKGLEAPSVQSPSRPQQSVSDPKKRAAAPKPARPSAASQLTKEQCDRKLVDHANEAATASRRFEQRARDSDPARKAKGMCADMRVMHKQMNAILVVAKACGPSKTVGLSLQSVLAARDNAAQNIAKCKGL